MGAVKAAGKTSGKRAGSARKARRRTKLVASAGKLIGRGGQATYRTGRMVGTARGAISGARIHRRLERGTGRVAVAAIAIGAAIGLLGGRALGRRGDSSGSGDPDEQGVAGKARSQAQRPGDAPKGDAAVGAGDGSAAGGTRKAS